MRARNPFNEKRKVMFTKPLLFLLLAADLASGQAPASIQAPATVPEVLTLDQVIREVHARNPALSSAQKLVEAQRRRVVQAGALPDPSLSVSYMGDAVPFKTQDMDPSSYRGINAMQMIPLGGKRELRREIARKEVNASEADQLSYLAG
jgi:cobalt-zinc-cadmium efflux system outer membrane protein